MNKFAAYDIPFTGLKVGSHEYRFEIGNAFFTEFDHSEIEDADFVVDLELEKQSNMLVLHFDIHGEVRTICDRCGDDLTLDTEYKDRIIVKFGEESIEQSDEIVVIAPHEHKINIAELVYEFTHLALPSKRMHEEGECNEAALEMLEDLSYDDSEESDPRWEELKKLKKDLK